MKKIIFATNNKNKLAEILPFLQGFSEKQLGEECEILTFEDLGVDIDVEEGEVSLYINAAKKAMESYEELVKLGMIDAEDIVVAEDSGLFGYEKSYPGVLTKRIMNQVGLESMLNRFRQNELPTGSFSHNKADAFYESAMAFYSKDIRFLTKSIEEGFILPKPTGKFNYPIDKYFKSKKRGFLGDLEPEEFSKTSFRLDAKKIPTEESNKVFKHLYNLRKLLDKLSKDYKNYEFVGASDTNDADYAFVSVSCSKHDIALLEAFEKNNCQPIDGADESISKEAFAAILNHRQRHSGDISNLSFNDSEVEAYFLSFLGGVGPYTGHNSYVYGTTEQIETLEELHEVQYLEKELNRLLSSPNISDKLASLGEY